MKKLLFSLLWFVLGPALVLALLIAVVYAAYRFQPSREKTAYPAMGQMVPSIYTSSPIVMKEMEFPWQ